MYFIFHALRLSHFRQRHFNLLRYQTSSASDDAQIFKCSPGCSETLKRPSRMNCMCMYVYACVFYMYYILAHVSDCNYLLSPIRTDRSAGGFDFIISYGGF